MAWLIEKGVMPKLEAQYFARSGGQFIWTSDVYKAIRFDSKEQADAVSADPNYKRLPPLLDPHSSVEHGFEGAA